MKRTVLIMLLAVVAVSFSTLAFAQDAMMKKEATKEQKKELKSVTCDPQCGFMVRSYDEKEITEVVKMHAKKQHNMDFTDKDVMDRMKTEGATEMKEIKKEVKKEEKKY